METPRVIHEDIETPRVIHDDKEFIIVDKPSGWIVNDAQTAKGQPVLQTWLDNNLKYELCGQTIYRSGIVHRLDKETSGLIIIAKTVAAFDNLQAQFKNRVVEKTYKALTHGKVNPAKGVINAPVGRLPWRRDRFGVLAGGREAFTSYETVSNYKDNKNNLYSLINTFPKTGRTHQIRIHLKHLGHPLVADEFYAGRKTARNDRVWCPRLFLHACAISFKHPVTHENLNFASDLPADLQKVIEKLTKLD
ncbi:RluA family pseudouridine synthase [Candidatus Woesebacteria bacterium]|nr:MAG: RluA family pseudouridine synthase [Candidatus Woesebacteria bacterium]